MRMRVSYIVVPFHMTLQNAAKAHFVHNRIRFDATGIRFSSLNDVLVWATGRAAVVGGVVVVALITNRQRTQTSSTCGSR